MEDIGRGATCGAVNENRKCDPPDLSRPAYITLALRTDGQKYVSQTRITGTGTGRANEERGIFGVLTACEVLRRFFDGSSMVESMWALLSRPREGAGTRRGEIRADKRRDRIAWRTAQDFRTATDRGQE